MSSRRYIKRIWRVPKDRGALEYFATLVTKALVKHGWPAVFELQPAVGGFHVYEQGSGPVDDLPGDFSAAIDIAVRIVARTYRLDADSCRGFVSLNRAYVVTPGGHFKQVK